MFITVYNYDACKSSFWPPSVSTVFKDVYDVISAMGLINFPCFLHSDLFKHYSIIIKLKCMCVWKR